MYVAVIFLSFDVKEWIVENDLLVHRLKVSIILIFAILCCHQGRDLKNTHRVHMVVGRSCKVMEFEFCNQGLEKSWKLEKFDWAKEKS